MEFLMKAIIFGLIFSTTISLLSFTTWKVITNEFLSKNTIKKLLVIYFLIGCGIYPFHFKKRAHTKTIPITNPY